MPEWGWGHHVTVGLHHRGMHGCSCVDDINTMWPSACAMQCRADSRFAPSQWETALLCNAVSHWLGASLESALTLHCGTQKAQVKRKPKPMVLHRVHLYLLKWSGAGRKFILLPRCHISDISSQISTNSAVYSTACSDWKQRTYQNFALVALYEGKLPMTGGFHA